jgi:hypothetical protein
MGKMITSDNLLNDRTILFEGKSTASLLIKRETNLRKLWQSPNVFTRVPCVEMIKVPLAECCEYTSDIQISRSKDKLPKIGEGIFGLLIQQVSSVDASVKFVPTTPMRYSNLLKISVRPTNIVYFWMYDNYLYVSNSETEAVSLYAFFEEEPDNSLLFPTDCACKNPPSEEDRCRSYLDREFKCPQYLVDGVKQMVYEKIMKFYEQVAKDVTSDNLDEGTK